MQMIKEKLYDPKRIHTQMQKGQLLIYNNKQLITKERKKRRKRHLWKLRCTRDNIYWWVYRVVWDCV